jgi:predicted Zn-ribbon and HTH transcriptional regulator
MAELVGIITPVRKLATCKRCGWKWFPRSLDPEICPHCKTKLWKEANNHPRAGRPRIKPPE